MSYPTWEEVFNKPSMSTCTVDVPAAWQGDGILVEIVNRECERLLANALFEPPITEEEIEKYAQRFKMTKRQAELHIREGREALNAISQRHAA